MTDLEKFIDLFKSFGIPLKAEQTATHTLTVSIEAKSHPQIGGYTGFVAEVYFNLDGSFNSMGVWEE